MNLFTTSGLSGTAFPINKDVEEEQNYTLDFLRIGPK